MTEAIQQMLAYETFKWCEIRLEEYANKKANKNVSSVGLKFEFISLELSKLECNFKKALSPLWSNFSLSFWHFDFTNVSKDQLWLLLYDFFQLLILTVPQCEKKKIMKQVSPGTGAEVLNRRLFWCSYVLSTSLYIYHSTWIITQKVFSFGTHFVNF